MINRTFSNYKFMRTYIGGSKKKELEMFSIVQDDENNNINCDWFKFKRMIIFYYDDFLNVILSWRNSLNYFSILTILLSAILFKYKLLSLVFLLVSIIFKIITYLLKRKLNRQIKLYDFSLTITLGEIYKISGIQGNKN